MQRGTLRELLGDGVMATSGVMRVGAWFLDVGTWLLGFIAVLLQMCGICGVVIMPMAGFLSGSAFRATIGLLYSAFAAIAGMALGYVSERISRARGGTGGLV